MEKGQRKQAAEEKRPMCSDDFYSELLPPEKVSGKRLDTIFICREFNLQAEWCTWLLHQSRCFLLSQRGLPICLMDQYLSNRTCIANDEHNYSYLFMRTNPSHPIVCSVRFQRSVLFCSAHPVLLSRLRRADLERPEAQQPHAFCFSAASR